MRGIGISTKYRKQSAGMRRKILGPGLLVVFLVVFVVIFIRKKPTKEEHLVGDEKKDPKKPLDFTWPENLKKPDVIKVGYPPRFYQFDKK